MSSFCSEALACCLSRAWEFSFKTDIVTMNVFIGHSQVEVLLESIMAVCWWGVGGDGMYMLFIVAAPSTFAVSGFARHSKYIDNID